LLFDNRAKESARSSEGERGIEKAVGNRTGKTRRDES